MTEEEQVDADALLKEELMSSIKQNLEDLFKKNAGERDLKIIKIKLEHAGDKKAIKMWRPVSLKSLKQKVKELYHKSLILYYTVPNSELIVPIQTQEDLDQAVDLVVRSDRQQSLRLSCSNYAVDTEPCSSQNIVVTSEASNLPPLPPSRRKFGTSRQSSSKGSEMSYGFHEICSQASTERSTSSLLSLDSASFSGSPRLNRELSSRASQCSDSPGCPTHMRLRRKQTGSSSSSSGFVADPGSAGDCQGCRSRKGSGRQSAFSPKAPTNWRQGRMIGSGAFGQVFVCYDADTGRELAVKKVQLIANMGIVAKEVMALENEIRLLRGLSHERIVQYFGCQQDDSSNSLCIFMEYMPGGSVKSEIKQYGPLTEAVTRKYVRQILEGLQYLHSFEIIHRDIKTANILRDAQGNVKIGDFGSGKRLQVICATTACGTFIGTPHYMAPEVVNGQKYGRRADIWSLGCCIVEMLTGSPPWDNLEPMAAIFKIATQSPSYTLPEGTSIEWNDLLNGMLSRHPATRLTAEQALSHDFLL